MNLNEVENYLMSIEQQTESHVASPNIQSLTGLSAEEIAEEVDLFFATSQPIFENEAAISNDCEREDTSEIGESNVGKRPASPQATSSKRQLHARMH
jgi:hypothetical protein